MLAISAGGRHTCAVTATGDAACWGANDWGQLGTGKLLASSEPARVTGLAGAAAGVAIGANHTCALLRPGGIECWGANDSGQLGTGKLLARSEPVRVTELAGAAAEVTSGDNHTCARMRHGRVWCWGANDLSQLGAGKFGLRGRPVMVRGLTIDQVAVGAGGDHTCSITGAGSVACWGWNYWGQLGNAAPPASGSPTPVDAIGFG